MIRRILLVALAAATVAVAGPLNRSIIDARLNTLDVLLERASSEAQGVPASLAILVRFELVRRRLEVGESSLANYELEARLLSLISGPQFSEAQEEVEAIPSSWLSEILLDVGHLLVGVPDYTTPERPWLPDLERAFLYERARRYTQAIAAYEELVESHDLEIRTGATIELHRAFCYAMANQLGVARTVTQKLLESGPDAELVTVARGILEFLSFVDQRREFLGAARMTGLERGRSLYFAMDYAAGEAALAAFVGRNTGDGSEAEARYYLGRTREEQGDPAEALKEYVRVGLLDPSGIWAREAMRRVLVLASLYYSDDDLAEQSRRQLVRLNDTEFTDTLDSYSGLIQHLPRIAEVAPGSATSSETPDTAELFVRTEPPGATIFVDDVERGISPLFVEDVAPGQLHVTAVAGNFGGRATVEAREGEITTIVLTLGMRFGRLRVRTNMSNVVVYLDETSALSVDSPALTQIVPGSYIVLIEGRDTKGEMYFTEREVLISPSETLTLEITAP